MEKITFWDVYEKFCKHNEEKGVTSQFSDDAPLKAVVVFKPESFKEQYTEEERSYRFASSNKYFVPGLSGNSIYGDCLDGRDRGVRLDYYLNEWKVDYCYIEEE